MSTGSCKLLMYRILLVIIGIIMSFSTAFSQCIDRQKIRWGGDYGNYHYSYLCPAYFFAYGGDTSRNWNTSNNNIDIRQAPVNALKFKAKVEQEIKKYAGESFFKNLKFYNVSVGYPDRLKLFLDSGARVSLKHYKAKYFYFYGFEPDTITAYLVGVAVNSSGKILTRFNFPSKRYYKPIDKAYTYCKLIDIAKNVQKDIDPIDEIKFDYDKKKKRFYWLISQATVNDREGINYINQVIIDAADLKKVSATRGQVTIVY